MKITICALTYKRPADLLNLLSGLDLLQFSAYPGTLIEIVIVDNDPDCSAKSVIAAYRSYSNWPILYVSEKRRGISIARNTAIASASEDTDFIAFIDDDEVPESHWLDKLLACHISFSSDVVVGPVIPKFTLIPPKWAIEGKFFERPRYVTGQTMPGARSGNVLIHLSVIKGMSSLFDERLGLTGGEDTEFFGRVIQSGKKIVWCDSAIVYEVIPASRVKTSWILKRYFRVGNTEGLITFNLHGGRHLHLPLPFVGIRRSLKGMISFIPSLFLGRTRVINSLISISNGIGIISGIFGQSYKAYGE